MSRPIADLLFDRFPHGLGTYPEHDLLELERHLRTIELVARQRWETLEGHVAAARASGRLPPQQLPRRLARAFHDLHQATELSATRLHRARRDIQRLRRFIASLPCAHGPLAQAREGWRRAHEVSHRVEAIWDDAAAFVADNPLRGKHILPETARINAKHIGSGWRRDGDDDPLVPDHGGSGTWTVGHIPPTGEIYAHRRSIHRPEQLWLLATDASPVLMLRLRRLRDRMREPNSLILLTQLAVHDCGERRRIPGAITSLPARSP